MIKSGLLDIDLTETSLLENYCCKWGVDGDMWNESFTAEDNELEKLEKIRSCIIDPLLKLKRKIKRNKTGSQYHECCSGNAIDHDVILRFGRSGNIGAYKTMKN